MNFLLIPILFPFLFPVGFMVLVFALTVGGMWTFLLPRTDLVRKILKEPIVKIVPPRFSYDKTSYQYAKFTINIDKYSGSIVKHSNNTISDLSERDFNYLYWMYKVKSFLSKETTRDDFNDIFTQGE